jgi:hypothetical protein
MLLSDSDIVTSASMAQVDSEVLAVAGTTKPVITLDGPGSLCEQTWGECGRRIIAAQQNYTTTFTAMGVSGGHQAAVNYIGGPARNVARVRLNQIVAHESQYGNTPSAVQLWMTYTALTLFYRDASARLKQDRLVVKLERAMIDADFSWRQLRVNGLPWVAQPMEAPGAKHGANAGSWTAANLSSVAGSGTQRTLQVAITYYDNRTYIAEGNTVNAESGPSVILPFQQAAGQVLQVSIAGLNPPTGVMDQVGLSQASWTPLVASNWILWVGVAGGPLYWQAAIPIGTQTFALPADPVLSGNTLGAGQWPDLNMCFTGSGIVNRA